MSDQQSETYGDAAEPEAMAHVVAFGGEAEGAGKSTLAIEMSSALLRMGYRVGVLDFSFRRKTLQSFFSNRSITKHIEDYDDPDLRLPTYRDVYRRRGGEPEEEAEERELQSFIDATRHLTTRCDVVIIDCDSEDSYLNRLGHAAADTIVTPSQDDISMFAQIDMQNSDILGPSLYSDLVHECQRLRQEQRQTALDWIAVAQPAWDGAAADRPMDPVLEKLSKRLGFRVAPGVRMQEKYLRLHKFGLTIFDFKLPQKASEEERAYYRQARAQLGALLDRFELPLRDLAA